MANRKRKKAQEYIDLGLYTPQKTVFQPRFHNIIVLIDT